MKSKTVLLSMALLLLTGMIPCAGQIKVKECVIYVPYGSPRSVTRAAQELKKYIRLATGNDLKIVYKPGSPMIALGNSPAAKAAGVDASAMKYESHIIRTVGKNLYIAGRDIPGDRCTERAGYSYGTLYGTYAFMNRVMDIAFLLPTDKGTYIPKLGKEWQIPTLNIQYTPQFEYRGFTSMPLNLGDILQWKIRNFSDGREDAGSVKVRHDHSWFFIYPNPGTLYHKAGNKDRFTTFRENPEFFYANSGGVRINPKFNFSLCLTNKEVWKDAAERYIRFENWRRNYYNRHSKYYMISLSPNDGTYCYCKECKSRYITLTEKEVGAWKTKPVKEFSNTDLMLDYYRRVTEYIAEKIKDVELGGLIYHNYMYAWNVKRRKMPPQFSAMMAPYHLSYGPGRLYSKINDSWHKWLNDWDGMFERKYYYGLDFWFKQYGGVPWPVFAKMRNDTYPVLAKKGFNGTYLYGMDNLGVTAVHNYLHMQQAWNPMLDAEKVLEDFCFKAYGKGGRYIREIYLLAEKNMIEFMTRIKGKMGYYMTPELMKDVYAKDWKQFTALMEKAISSPRDENQEWRLDHFVQNMRVFNFHLEKMGLIPVNKNSKLYLSDEEYASMTPLRSKGGKKEFYLPQVPLNRYAAQAQIPVRETRAHSFKGEVKPVWFHLTVDLLVKALSDRVTFQIEQKASLNPVSGKPYLDGIPYFNVYTQDGKFYYSGIAAQNRISFPARKGETYFLWIYPQSDTTYGHYWSIVKANSPYAIGTRIHPSGVQLCRTPVDSCLYFFMPEKVKKFEMTAQGWGGFEVLDPDGKKIGAVKEANGYKVLTFRNSGKDFKKGVYKIHFTKTYYGKLRFSKEMPGFFVQDPSLALEVIPDEQKLKEHRKKFNS
jgi:hypothetical protein